MSTELEKELNKLNAVEVWLIASEILFIDCNLKNEIWHGKNMAICAKRIIVIEKIRIDVSGLNGKPENKPLKAKNGQQDGNESDKNGTHGENGTNGESEGNITIVEEIIEDRKNLTIKTNSGKGSYGQDGGNGADGENGLDSHRLTLDEFKRNFPPPAKYFSKKSAGK